MVGSGFRVPIDACRSVEQSPGVRSEYRIPNADGSAVFAAKLRFDSARVGAGNLTHGILACRASGTARLTRRTRGSCVHRRPTIGSVTYVAPDTPAVFCGEGSCEVCHIYLAPDSLRRFAESDLTGAAIPRINDLFAVEDPWLKGYFQMLVSEFDFCADGERRADALFVTQAEHLLIHHLLRWHSDAASRDVAALQRVPGANPLRPATLNRVEEYVAANLAGDIKLPDLATVACMSIGHFLRAFRAASGTTPYQYVLEQRLRRASSLLRTTTLPVTRIAAECGFKTSAHLSSKFHARVGASPSRYRASSRS
jgi:AraC family transcriptional regulator